MCIKVCINRIFSYEILNIFLTISCHTKSSVIDHVLFVSEQETPATFHNKWKRIKRNEGNGAWIAAWEAQHKVSKRPHIKLNKYKTRRPTHISLFSGLFGGASRYVGRDLA